MSRGQRAVGDGRWMGNGSHTTVVDQTLGSGQWAEGDGQKVVGSGPRVVMGDYW